MKTLKQLDAENPRTYGVESIEVCGRVLHYVNTGDSYAETWLQEGEGEPYRGSWGEWVEAVEAEHANETRPDCSVCGMQLEGDACRYSEDNTPYCWACDPVV